MEKSEKPIMPLEVQGVPALADRIHSCSQAEGVEPRQKGMLAQPDQSPWTHVIVYTDGGCDPNPGPGGWGAVIRWGHREWVLSGNEPNTTNNRMELMAAAAALALLDGLAGRCQVEVHTDSEYLCQGITEWIEAWVNRDWLTSENEPVKNQDLWRLLHRLVGAHHVSWHWLRGHSGHPFNERADRLATEARSSLLRVPSVPDVHQPADDDRPAVEISVKASCRGAHGPGGWGAVLRVGEHSKTLSGRDPAATANAMLVRGAAEALRALNRPCQVTLYSDAKYLTQGASQWVRNWQARGWQTRDGKPVANREEWEALLQAAQPHQIAWTLVQGDAGVGDLERAGSLAGQASEIEKRDS
jgi:ribonuclease HI